MMASREPSARAKKSVSLSVILGTLLVPLSAFAASNLVESTAAPGTSITAAASPVTETVVTEPGSPARDLETACGEAGLAMVAAEAAGSIGDLQQAALDALRGVCAEQGTPLPTPPTTQTVVSTAVPAPSASAPAIDQVGVALDDTDHGDDHGGHGDDDHDGDGDDDHGKDHD
jgi:hypothetical protein